MTREENTIRSALAAEVARQGWTLTELARLTGIAQPHIGEYLRGVRDWNTRTADRLLAALGMRLVGEPVANRRSSRRKESIERREQGGD